MMYQSGPSGWLRNKPGSAGTPAAPGVPEEGAVVQMPIVTIECMLSSAGVKALGSRGAAGPTAAMLAMDEMILGGGGGGGPLGMPPDMSSGRFV